MPGLRVLQYLLAVVETGHFGLAAERCEVSASTLSGQLRRFEDYLGAQLIERGRTGPILPRRENASCLGLASPCLPRSACARR